MFAQKRNYTHEWVCVRVCLCTSAIILADGLACLCVCVCVCAVCNNDNRNLNIHEPADCELVSIVMPQIFSHVNLRIINNNNNNNSNCVKCQQAATPWPLLPPSIADIMQAFLRVQLARQVCELRDKQFTIDKSQLTGVICRRLTMKLSN